MRTNLDVQIEIAPADGIKLSFFLRNVAVFGQLSVKATCLTVWQRTMSCACAHLIRVERFPTFCAVRD
jgi:hypothetical protein